jgi:hypothetical protein
MSFLDNLENNLKALESLEAGGLDDRKRREADRARTLAAAPWAEKLKKSAYVPKLMRDLTRAGYSRRMKVNFVWIGTALRLEAMNQRVELQPTPTGVEAVFSGHVLPIDLNGEPDALIHEWMQILDRRREEESALAAASLAAAADEEAKAEAHGAVAAATRAAAGSQIEAENEADIDDTHAV